LARVAAENQRKETQKALDRAEGLRMTAVSSAALPTNPGLALLMGIEGAGKTPGVLANNALLAALDACDEERTIYTSPAPCQSVAYSADGKRILTSAPQHTITLWDA